MSVQDDITNVLNSDNPGVTEVAPEKIKVGDKEYTQDELSRVVGLGEIGLKLEADYDTKIDRVWPEYQKSRQELKTKNEQLSSLTKELDEIKSKVSNDNLPEEQAIAQAREAAKKIGLITDDSFVDKMSQSFRQLYQEERAAERLLDEVKGFEKDIDGKDGRPKFDSLEILTYMQENSIQNPMTAYKLKFENELDSWKEAQLGKIKPKGFSSIDRSTAGSKVPATPPAPTRDNLGEAIREALHPNE